MNKRSKSAAPAAPAAKKPADPRDTGGALPPMPPASTKTDDMETRPAKKKKRAEDLVSVTVPTAFQLTTDDGERVQYQSGIQDMPHSHAHHFYAKANGVEINE